MSAYIVNMPVELLLDGYIAYKHAQSEGDKLKKDRYLRTSLILLFAAFEAELNRQLHVTSYKDEEKIDKRLKKLLNLRNVSQINKASLLSEMDNMGCPESFRAVRNGITHFKGDYSLYGITEKNIDRYFQFTKSIFEIVHTEKVVDEWLTKVVA